MHHDIAGKDITTTIDMIKYAILIVFLLIVDAINIPRHIDNIPIQCLL